MSTQAGIHDFPVSISRVADGWPASAMTGMAQPERHFIHLSLRVATSPVGLLI